MTERQLVMEKIPGTDKKVQWNKTRSPIPFVLNLWAETGEKLFGLSEEGVLMDCTDGVSKTITLKPGMYNIVGGQIEAGINYLNIITVSQDGAIEEKIGAIDDIRNSL